MCATSIESFNLLENVRIILADLFRDQTARFGYCVSDLAMSAAIGTQFVRFYPELEKLRSNHHNLKTGSLIAHFSSKICNWIYDLVIKDTL